MNNVIELHNVSKKFKGFEIRNISLEVKSGFVTGFIGANGAGKSTTIKMIMNLLAPDSGEVSIFGLDYAKNEKQIKERIGFVYDDNVFYESLNLKEMKKIVAPSYQQWDEKLFNNYIERFNLPLNKKIKTFSKGMKMKASLALALSHNPELIIMDEPTSGLDPVFRRELLELLHDLMIEEDKTIFFSTHITTDLDRIADYIAFIQNGRLVYNNEFHLISEEYAIVKGALDLLDSETEKEFISIRKANTGFEALTSNVQSVKDMFGKNIILEKPSLEDIMYYSQRGKVNA
ncbi:ABC transporter ATP-binding protein [Ureibacillus aquaedulcis]|uniref:ABC transporter ATP-binding protein n=1 Tax=Ureibacillus aquaedulcis TaxID=3058421 RepID=A0ABT8GVU4_9BACL|nr:ABC transporter ATP-binding protein [Ureibacillus sp. BA0131]MDN4495538.1 ABC transporter ATP-binding protein [Ureibacillus sp. BA0131]